MPSQELGTLTVVISENHRENEAIHHAEAAQLTTSFTQYFNYLLSQRGLDKKLTVTKVEWSMGCVTIALTIGLAAGFLKDYKDVREGWDMLVDDLKNAGVWVNKRFRRKKPAPSVPAPKAQAEPDTTTDPLEIMFEQLSRSYKAIPPEQRKFWSAGQEITIMDEKGDLCHYTIAIKKEEIHFPG